MSHVGGRDAGSATTLSRSKGTVCRVVIVDDTPDIRLLLRLALESVGDISVVAEAADGREAVDVVGESQPDLVILDLAMPVMGGMEAIPHLRRACPDARILVLSGFSTHELAHRVIDAGAHGYLQKGVSTDALVSRVRVLVSAS